MRLDRLLVGKGIKGVKVLSYDLLGTQRIAKLVRGSHIQRVDCAYVHGVGMDEAKGLVL